MLLLQLIPVSPSQIPKTSRKVTNLRAESYLVHNVWLFFTTQINFASQWCNRLISQMRQSHLIWWVPHKLVQTLGKPEIIFISSLFLPEEIIIYFPWKKKSKNSKISGTNSEATSGHSEETFCIGLPVPRNFDKGYVIWWREKQVFDAVLCRFLTDATTAYLEGAASVATLVTIATECYFAVINPLSNRLKPTTGKQKVCAGIIILLKLRDLRQEWRENWQKKKKVQGKATVEEKGENISCVILFLICLLLYSWS